MVRRSSFAVAAALTTVALTTTAAVSFAGDGGDAVASAAEKVAQPAAQPVAITSAVATDPEVRSASEKADAVLTDADYVTQEGDLNSKERRKLRAATRELRGLVSQARDAAVTATALRQNTPASRSTERASLADRAADASAGSATTDDVARDTAADATDPTNLAVAAAGVTPLGGQQTESLPILATPLADSVVSTEAAQDSEQAEPAADTADTEGAAESAAAAPSADKIEKVTTSLQRLITRTDGDAVVSVKAGPTPEEIAAARRAVLEARADRAAARAAERQAVLDARAERAAAAARERAAEAKRMAQAAKQYGNGQIPSSVLCGVSFASGEKLRCDAAAALEDLNRAFRSAFGRNLSLTDGYRSYSEQVAVSASRGALAAVPGTSNHGWGQAVDLSGGIQSFGSAEFSWMQANAGKYGWKHPGWAQAGGSKPEPWHWEFGTSY